MRKTVSIGEVIFAALRENGLDKPLLEKQVVERWPELMGPMVASMTRSVQVENGVLIVKINNAALKSQLFEQRYDLVKKINDTLGAKVIREVKLQG